MQTPIPPPHNLSPKPDKATSKGISDYTGSAADQRVLHINIWFLKYGTNDKVHAAALVFSLILLITIISLVFVGMDAKNQPWADKTFSWLGGAFLFISGVALGKGTSQENLQKVDDE